MEDWLKCQISPLVKYRQNQKTKTMAIIIVYADMAIQWSLLELDDWNLLSIIASLQS